MSHILVWSKFGDSLSLARLMKEKDGNDVLLYIDAEYNKRVGEGIVDKVENWRDYIDWADLIVVDDENQGEWVEELENKGKVIFGTNQFGGKLENDREYAFKLCKELGIKTVPYWKFSSLDEGIKFIKDNPGKYVFKPFGQRPRWYTKVGELIDGKDMVWFIEYLKNIWQGSQDFILQKYIEGVEIGCCSWFNREKFLKPLECYDDQTEILTEKGWKYFKDINTEDKVASLVEDELIFVKPIGYIKKYYEGKMFKYKDRNFDILVTARHSIYLQSYSGNSSRFIEAEKIKQSGTIKRDFIWNGIEQEYFILDGYVEQHYQGQKKYYYPIKHNEIKIKMDDWLEFFGLYLAEGNIYNNNVVVISQKNIDKRDDIINTVKKLPFNFGINKQQIRISNTQLALYLNQFGKSYDKYIPNEIKNLSIRQLKILIDNMMKGDGTKIKNGGRLYTTTSKKLADDLQEIILKSGKIATIYEKQPRRIWFKKEKRFIEGNKKQYLVYEFKNNKDTLYHLWKQKIQWNNYEGYVYCVEVPSNVIYVRRNGKSYWCGNCCFEHKKSRGYGQGGNVGEAGSLIFAVNESRIFDEILQPFESHLKNTKYVGQFYANTKVNEEGIWLLEFVPRLGIPATYGYNELLQIRWSDLFYELATSKLQEMPLELNRFVVVVKIDIEPVPDLKHEATYFIPTEIPIFFNFDPIGAEPGFFEGDLRKENEQYYLTGKQGHIGCVIGSDSTVPEAQDLVYKTAEQIHSPVEIIYNPEIGDKFEYVKDFLKEQKII